jgi:hypothetical protein
MFQTIIIACRLLIELQFTLGGTFSGIDVGNLEEKVLNTVFSKKFCFPTLRAYNPYIILLIFFT